jgi:predicted ATP-grasp superfamily ATP-dependent carboligase
LNSFNTHLLICGTSTRAAAASAARAGFAVTTIDGYADRDQHPGVRALSMPRDFCRPFTARAAARASRTVDCDAVAYLSSFENHPRAVRALAQGRALWGNSPDVLTRVRNPVIVAEAMRNRGFAVPVVRYGDTIDRNRSDSDGWMLKPFRSGGGRRVRPWQGERVPRDCYLQERIDGVAGSVVFVAAGGEAVMLGVSRQLIGEAAFGADGYRYCGSILDAACSPQSGEGSVVTEHARALARAAAAEFGLIGLNGIDFVVANGVPHPIEINPRWSSSMELVERICGVSVFDAHADACERHALPRLESIEATRGIGSVGKAIVFARHDVIAGDTDRWVDEADVRDVPHPGDHIRKGEPVCTVFAAGPDADACYDALVRRAESIHAELETWTGL